MGIRDFEWEGGHYLEGFGGWKKMTDCMVDIRERIDDTRKGIILRYWYVDYKNVLQITVQIIVTKHL